MKREFPNLFIPGAGKSATSSMHQYLKKHPLICMMPVKEPHFFSIDNNYEKGFEQYLNLFNVTTFDLPFYGESSTTYFASIKAMERIRNDIINPKFIFVLRDPIQRIVSHYNWIVSLGEHLKPFREEVEADNKIPFDPNHSFAGCYYKSYLEFSHYGKWISRYHDFFGKENIHIVVTESLKKDPLTNVNSCMLFLKLNQLKSISEVKENETKNFFTTEKSRIGFHQLKKLLPTELKDKFKENAIAKPFLVKKKFHRIQPYLLQEEDKKWLMEILLEDVKLLKKITTVDYTYWKDIG